MTLVHGTVEPPAEKTSEQSDAPLWQRDLFTLESMRNNPM